MMGGSPNQKSIFVNPNPTLLTADNSPLKFYLDGFDVLEFLHTSAIIKEYGGEVTVPDRLTIVLAKPNTIPAIKSLRFDVNWLYDSLQKGQTLNLGPYLLPEVIVGNNNETENATKISDNLEGPKVDEKPSPDEEEENSDVDEGVNDQVINTIPSSFTTPRQSADSVDTDDEESSKASSRSSTAPSVIIDDLPPQLSPMGRQTSNKTSSSGGIFSAFRQTNIEFPGGTSVLKNTQNCTVSSTRTRRPGPKSRGSYGFEDCKSILKKEMKAVPKKKYVGKKTKLETHSGGQKTVKKSQSIVCSRKSSYSFEEERKMFDYAVKNDLISVFTKKTTCNEMKDFLPGRSLASVCSHTRRLIDRINNFTADPEIIKQFRAVGFGSRERY